MGASLNKLAVFDSAEKAGALFERLSGVRRGHSACELADALAAAAADNAADAFKVSKAHRRRRT